VITGPQALANARLDLAHSEGTLDFAKIPMKRRLSLSEHKSNIAQNRRIGPEPASAKQKREKI
jgi:hypothetical protein